MFVVKSIYIQIDGQVYGSINWFVGLYYLYLY